MSSYVLSQNIYFTIIKPALYNFASDLYKKESSVIVVMGVGNVAVSPLNSSFLDSARFDKGDLRGWLPKCKLQLRMI